MEKENLEIINPDDKDYYDGKLYQVGIWPGAGYELVTFNVYADCEQTALELAVADAEFNAQGLLMSIPEMEDYIMEDWHDECEAFIEENEDSDADEYTFAEEYLNYIYVDATEYGASQPYFITRENLRIEEVQDKKEEGKEDEIPYDNTTKKVCPKCGKEYTEFPAISRRDNKTYICPECGFDEAMEDYMKSMKKENNMCLENKQYNFNQIFNNISKIVDYALAESFYEIFENDLDGNGNIKLSDDEIQTKLNNFIENHKDDYQINELIQLINSNFNVKNEENKVVKEAKDYDYIIYRQRLTKSPIYVKDYSTETENKDEAITFPTRQEAEEYRDELELSYKEQYKIGVKNFNESVNNNTASTELVEGKFKKLSAIFDDEQKIVIDNITNMYVQYHYETENGKDGPYESKLNGNQFKDEDGNIWDLENDFGYTVTKKQEGDFDKLSKKIFNKGKQDGMTKDDANAIAASIGRKKYGKEKFQKMAQKGKKTEAVETSNISWENIENYDDEEKEEIRNILSDLDVEAVKIDGHSVAVKIKSNGMVFWIDYSLDGQDIVGDWNQYIFDTTNSDDRIRQAIQTSYYEDTKDTLAFDIMESIGLEYLEQNNIVKMIDDGYKFVDDKKEESYNKDGFPNSEELVNYFKELNDVPDTITLDDKTYKMTDYGGTGANSYAIYTDENNDDSYIKVFYSLKKLGDGVYKGIDEIKGVSDLREAKVVESKELKEDNNTLERTFGRWKIVIEYRNGKPVAKFYDMDEDPKKFPDGQFVSSYYVETLLGQDGYGRPINEIEFLSLDNGVPEWVIGKEDLQNIYNWFTSLNAQEPVKENRELTETDYTFLSPSSIADYNDGIIEAQSVVDCKNADDCKLKAKKFNVDIENVEPGETGFIATMKGNLQDICNFISGKRVNMYDFMADDNTSVMLFKESKK